jgi:hypothetical protein
MLPCGRVPRTITGEPYRCARVFKPTLKFASWRMTMGRGLLLWLIGIPLPIILIIWLFGGLS